jgi:murein DD-endopeptidase MepM/ murein hydrolase activator NlpD
MIAPVEMPIITSRYGYRVDPLGTSTQFHDGIDIISKVGNIDVYAMVDCVVIYDMDNYNHLKRLLSPNTGGNMIVVAFSKDNTSYFMRYLHLGKNTVRMGETIHEGAKVGTYGDYGRSKGPHVHIDIYKNGWKEKIDPLILFRDVFI